MSKTISALLQDAERKLTKLDAEILLAHVLKVSRSYLYAWPEKIILPNQEKYFFELIERRIQREPIAYTIGHQEFWSLDFLVTPDVLIPRPETELLVELLCQFFRHCERQRINPRSLDCFADARNDEKAGMTVADLGTGSGAIALSIAHECPDWKVHATDVSAAALKIAAKNAENLQIKNVQFHQGSWLSALPNILFDVIVSNPPYIAEDDLHLINLSYEPNKALVSGIDGLNAIRDIILNAKKYLKNEGYLLLEHGYDQAAQVRKLFEESGYIDIQSQKDLSGIERVTMGKKSTI